MHDCQYQGRLGPGAGECKEMSLRCESVTAVPSPRDAVLVTGLLVDISLGRELELTPATGHADVSRMINQTGDYGERVGSLTIEL